MESADWLALGRHLLRAGRRADGWRALRRAAELADGPPSALAGVLLARGLARRGLHAAAERLLADLQHRQPDEVCLAVLRARLLERSLHRPAAAHAVVSAALARLPMEGVHRIDLDRRLARLERRLRRQGDRRPVEARRQPAQRELFLRW
jgi:hypothetical protein